MQNPLLWAARFVWLGAITLIGMGGSPAVDAKSPKVLVIGIDGLRGDALRQADTPFLDRLASNGMINWDTRVTSDNVTTSDTVSGPGWTTFLTGTWADRHGVLDNSFKGRDPKAAPHAFHLIKQVQPALQTASFLDWTPLATHVTTDADIDVVVTPTDATEHYDGADRALAQMAAITLRDQPIDIAFVYLGAVDEAGHAFGFHPSVAEYIARIEATDQLIGQILSAVERRAHFDSEDWLIVVSCDHAGEGKGHGGGRKNPNINIVPMIVSGTAAARGDDLVREAATTDVMAVALTHLKIPIDPAWQLAGNASGWLKQESQ